jgi:hypothetical protein
MTMATAPTKYASRAWLKLRRNYIPGDVLAALDELGIQIIRVTGEEATARCHMHYGRTGKDDTHPSWSCNVESGVFNCYSCGWKGTFPQIVCDVLGVSWDDAVEWVRQRGGIERVNKILGRGQYIDDLVPEKPPVTYTEADLALFTLPPARALTKRGLTVASCQEYGVLWDPSRGMWITPIRDAEGSLLGWQEKNERYFRNRPYEVGKSKTVFGFHLLPPGGTAILLESPLDCLRLSSVGIPGAVSSYGAEVSDAQMQLLFGHCKLIVLALDNDRDGWKHAMELKRRYRGMGRRLAFYNYGDCDAKDPGDQSGDEIRYGVHRRLSPLRVRFSCS